MNVVRGRVRRGHIETDVELPDGAEVVVLTGADAETFVLEDGLIAELEVRIAEAERGEVEPAAAVLARLRARQ